MIKTLIRMMIIASPTYLMITSCTSRTHHQGVIMKESNINQLVVDVHKKNDVFNILGSPSIINCFGRNIWTYNQISSQKKYFSYLVIDEFKQLKITFVNNIVKEIEYSSVIPGDFFLKTISQRSNLRKYKEKLLEQIFNNFGKISGK
jgi:outer membrane protein assembly factor BamE (lipoprotein component of BamABCDE complex)